MKGKSAPEFLDNVDQAMELVGKMEKSLPLFVYPNSALVRFLRKRGVRADRYQKLEIRNVFYLGNEGGISCDITPKGHEHESIICSLTQLKVIGTDALAEEMKAYQQERIKKLAR